MHRNGNTWEQNHEANVPLAELKGCVHSVSSPCHVPHLVGDNPSLDVEIAVALVFSSAESICVSFELRFELLILGFINLLDARSVSFLNVLLL